MNIIIIGGGKVGYFLSEKLKNDHNIVIIEKNKEKCEKISNDLGIVVINGDGSDLEVLKGAEINKTNVVIATTGKDEDNLVACQIINNNFNGIRTIVRVNNPKNEKVMEELGVDIAVSSTSVISQLIKNEITSKELVTLMTFKRGNMAIVELSIPENSFADNKSVVSIAKNLPENSVLVSVIRNGKVIFPKGNTILKSNDSIVAVTTVQNQKEFESIFLKEKN
ncbi:MAG: trk/ktr system potassium uptake protein [Oceanotoga sp.]|jgi:trk system potassium uptake protein TrkA|uniref:potassium channel family protein n=1 Tax=Oceanotoga sp. TaxID=2108366 RepID=UPI0026531986|nr:TrkA family potassium uptake protein [Oceanotoga sp.]MDN5343026.1 trk/ktr system potassium uptake protein [Oceanotoga sp.]